MMGHLIINLVLVGEIICGVHQPGQDVSINFSYLGYFGFHRASFIGSILKSWFMGHPDGRKNLCTS